MQRNAVTCTFTHWTSFQKMIDWASLYSIDFTVKDDQGCVVASTRTTPILITDDRRPIISVTTVPSPTVPIPPVPEPRIRGPRAPKRPRISAGPYATYSPRTAVISPDAPNDHRITLPASIGRLKESQFPSQPSQAVYRPPSISDLLPAFGPLLGGPKIAVVGSNFNPEYNLSVMFGFNPASEVTYRSADLIICKLPPSPVPGAVRVVLTSTVPLPLPPTPLIFTYTDTREQDL
jgi:IPT/TIG domain